MTEQRSTYPPKLASLPSRIEVKINRLQSKKAMIENKLKAANKSQRKARTRTLIQLGGLLNMLNLPNICGINPGDDLQTDFEASDKAAVLLGMLVHLEDSLPPTLSDPVIDRFKQKGILVLKNHKIQRTRESLIALE